jgi:sugar phosphate isomerase/epimerase
MGARRAGGDEARARRRVIVRRYTLAPLMAMHYTPPQLIELAAQAGVWGCGVRLLPTVPGALHYPLMNDAALLRETLARMEALGIAVFDLEMIRIGERFLADDHTGFFEVGQRLGAQVINVACDDEDLSRLADSFAALCDAAAPYGLCADIEPMPWSAVPDVATAQRVLAAAARPNCGVLIDALHFARSRSTLADIDALPREWLHYGQICDGALPGPSTREGLIHDARCERLLPGEGDIDLRALFARLPRDVPVSIEVPNDQRAPAIGYEAWAKAALAATRALLGDERGG